MAVLYARVSSKDQEREGFSIPAQLRLLHEYAAKHGFVVAEEFTDVETARESGRTRFGEMIAHLKKHRTRCRTVLVEKTDRLYRNIKDFATLDELDIEIHFVKENTIIGPETRSSEQFVHGIKVLMARNYSQNLAEETVKGMTEKARAGIYPSYAPVGYCNIDGPQGKRILAPDEDSAPVIKEIYARFSQGNHSVRALVKELNREGYRLRGRRLHSSLVHQILRKRIYMGEFEWNGATYQGIHEPLVSEACWRRVQELLDARAEHKTRRVKHDFAFTGLVRCGHCGCLMVGELKKGKYLYYHCTGNRGKCPEPYTREEILTDKFAAVLQELVIPKAILDWLDDAVLASDRTERAAREDAVRRLQFRYDQIAVRINTMYMDKLDGRITQDFFDEKAGTFRAEQEVLLRKIANIRDSAPAPVDQAIDMLQLTSRAAESFAMQPSDERRRLLRVMVETASWQGGELRTTLFEPFEILRHSNSATARNENANNQSDDGLKVWLRGQDSNLRMA